jgi:hypothetical protein
MTKCRDSSCHQPHRRHGLLSRSIPNSPPSPTTSFERSEQPIVRPSVFASMPSAGHFRHPAGRCLAAALLNQSPLAEVLPRIPSGFPPDSLRRMSGLPPEASDPPEGRRQFPPGGLTGPALSCARSAGVAREAGMCLASGLQGGLWPRDNPRVTILCALTDLSHFSNHSPDPA